ncbi:transketolase family protein [Photobacterium gaetbulicola]|uniref:transketolase family protein n=1 Tax=Photobacterium gaetbulicola TaxID=1295392 RepID=UPI00068B18EF|nr:transketolase C-terminal domain-containing protein [Photobacterium gaetbulicola]
MKKLVKSTKPTRLAFAERMVEYGDINKDFAVFEADIGYSTNSYLFNQKYPERYFQMGIAEFGMMASASGMAASGRPVVVAGYGVFLTMRALESVRSFICYPNLNVKLMSSHGGTTAAIDGVTHQASEDIALMTSIPNMHVFAPCDSASTRALFDVTMETQGPVYCRLMRDAYYELYDESFKFSCGGSHVVCTGSDLTIVSYGDILFQAIEAAEELRASGISVEVIDAYSVKPLDWETIKTSIKKTGHLIVAEGHQQRNGMAYEIAARMAKAGISAKFKHLGLKDTFAESGAYPMLLEKYGLSAKHIIDAAIAMGIKPASSTQPHKNQSTHQQAQGVTNV